MPTSGVRAEAIAARLSALGFLTRVEEHPWHTTVEVEMPDDVSAETWQKVLDAVSTADQFGLLATSLNARTLWAVVRKAVPTTGDVGGPSHQR
ncbi:hypothetical protein ACFWNW_25370 [Streptomyces seoulensis]|uniref:hypothetical protein n=1 Tax=Streptomyces seoulensis TaxID=73044 RepID=UPI00365E0E10